MATLKLNMVLMGFLQDILLGVADNCLDLCLDISR